MKNKHSTNYYYSNYITIQDIFHPEYLQPSAPLEEEQQQQQEEQEITIPAENVVAVVTTNESGTHQQQNRHQNRWEVVWAEATLLNDTTNSYNEIHNATVVSENEINVTGTDNNNTSTQPQPVVNNNDMELGNNVNTTTTNNNNNNTKPDMKQTTTTPHVNNSSNHDSNNNTPLDAPYYHGNIIEITFGLCFALTAVLSTCALELCSILIYLVATILYQLAIAIRFDNMSILSLVIQLCSSIFVLIAKILLIVDSILLVSSIIVSESLAFTAYILNSIFSCCKNGTHWHQYIRKMCHLIRWAFRDIYITSTTTTLEHEKNELQRTFPFCQRQRHHDHNHNRTSTKTKNSTITNTKN